LEANLILSPHFMTAAGCSQKENTRV